MGQGARKRVGLGLTILFGLAACAADPKGMPAPAYPAAPVAPASLATGDSVAPALSPTVGAINPLLVTTTGAAQPGRLIGLNRDAVLQTLGRPIFMREDGPAQLWRYPWAECYLEVFLFRDQGVYQVTHAEVRPRLAAAGTPASCADRGTAARRPRPAS